MVLLEAVGDVFEENEAEDDVLVLLSAPALPLRAALSGRLSRSARLRRVHVVAPVAFGCLRCAPAVGGEPELGLETEVGGSLLFDDAFGDTGHGQGTGRNVLARLTGRERHRAPQARRRVDGVPAGRDLVAGSVRVMGQAAVLLFT